MQVISNNNKNEQEEQRPQLIVPPYLFVGGNVQIGVAKALQEVFERGQDSPQFKEACEKNQFSLASLQKECEEIVSIGIEKYRQLTGKRDREVAQFINFDYWTILRIVKIAEKIPENSSLAIHQIPLDVVSKHPFNQISLNRVYQEIHAVLPDKRIPIHHHTQLPEKLFFTKRQLSWLKAVAKDMEKMETSLEKRQEELANRMHNTEKGCLGEGGKSYIIDTITKHFLVAMPADQFEVKVQKNEVSNEGEYANVMVAVKSRKMANELQSALQAAKQELQQQKAFASQRSIVEMLEDWAAAVAIHKREGKYTRGKDFAFCFVLRKRHFALLDLGMRTWSTTFIEKFYSDNAAKQSSPMHHAGAQLKNIRTEQEQESSPSGVHFRNEMQTSTEKPGKIFVTNKVRKKYFQRKGKQPAIPLDDEKLKPYSVVLEAIARAVSKEYRECREGDAPGKYKVPIKYKVWTTDKKDVYVAYYKLPCKGGNGEENLEEEKQKESLFVQRFAMYANASGVAVNRRFSKKTNELMLLVYLSPALTKDLQKFHRDLMCHVDLFEYLMPSDHARIFGQHYKRKIKISEEDLERWGAEHPHLINVCSQVGSCDGWYTITMVAGGPGVGDISHLSDEECVREIFGKTRGEDVVVGKGRRTTVFGLFAGGSILGESPRTPEEFERRGKAGELPDAMLIEMFRDFVKGKATERELQKMLEAFKGKSQSDLERQEVEVAIETLRKLYFDGLQERAMVDESGECEIYFENADSTMSEAEKRRQAEMILDLIQRVLKPYCMSSCKIIHIEIIAERIQKFFAKNEKSWADYRGEIADALLEPGVFRYMEKSSPACCGGVWRNVTKNFSGYFFGKIDKIEIDVEKLIDELKAACFSDEEEHAIGSTI